MDFTLYCAQDQAVKHEQKYYQIEQFQSFYNIYLMTKIQHQATNIQSKIQQMQLTNKARLEVTQKFPISVSVSQIKNKPVSKFERPTPKKNQSQLHKNIPGNHNKKKKKFEGLNPRIQKKNSQAKHLTSSSSNNVNNIDQNNTDKTTQNNQKYIPIQRLISQISIQNTYQSDMSKYNNKNELTNFQTFSKHNNTNFEFSNRVNMSQMMPCTTVVSCDSNQEDNKKCMINCKSQYIYDEQIQFIQQNTVEKQCNGNKNQIQDSFDEWFSSRLSIMKQFKDSDQPALAIIPQKNENHTNILRELKPNNLPNFSLNSQNKHERRFYQPSTSANKSANKSVNKSSNKSTSKIRSSKSPLGIHNNQLNTSYITLIDTNAAVNKHNALIDTWQYGNQ